MHAQALLNLLHLSGPTLPIGGFAYSQGLEYAIDSGWIADADQLEQWLEGVLGEGLAKVELPVICRFYQAYQNADDGEVEYWNQWLLANRETKELLFEDQQLGQALRRLLISLGIVDREVQLPESPTYCSQFALAAAHHDIPLDATLSGFSWNWLENQIAVACKTLPLGQTAAQQLMIRLMPLIGETVEQAQQLSDPELGATLPGLAMASALHETQYSRLFRS